MSHRGDFFVALAVTVVGIAVMVLSIDIPLGQFDELVGPRTLPMTLGATMAIIGMGLAVRRAIWWSRKPDQPAVQEGTADDPGEPGSALRAMTIAGSAFAYVWLIPVIGFQVATPIFMVWTMWTMRVRDWQRLIGVPLGFVVIVHLFFVRILHMTFPPGSLWG